MQQSHVENESISLTRNFTASVLLLLYLQTGEVYFKIVVIVIIIISVYLQITLEAPNNVILLQLTCL